MNKFFVTYLLTYSPVVDLEELSLLKIKLVFSVSTTQIGTKLDLIGGTTAQGTTTKGDNCTKLSHFK